MKTRVFLIVLMMTFLVILMPLASTSPDGLERVAETLGIESGSTLWKGIMPDYSLESIGNSYLSTIVVGVFGIVMALFASLALGKILSRKGNNIPENKV